MFTEYFILLNARCVKTKKDKEFYLATIYSTTYNYTQDVFISKDTYNLIVDYSQEELMRFDLTNKISKIVVDNKPQLRLVL